MNTRKIVIGTAAALIIALAFGVGAVALQRSSRSESGYCAYMSDAIGLYEGNPVTQMGYKVGTVERIRPQGDHAEVTFALDPGRKYPVDVKAVTRSKSVLADRSLELVGNYQSGPQLVAGRCIGLASTATPKSISEIFGSAADFVDAVAPKDSDQTLAGTVNGLATALQGQSANTYNLMLHASAAASSPDQMIADLGAVITNMAPLTTEMLERWSTVYQILDQLPTVVTAAAYGMWPGAVNLTVGTGFLAAVLYDMQTNYADIIWPAADVLADGIHLAATRSDDIKSLLSSIPAVAAMLRQQAGGRGGLTVAYQPPTVEISSGDGPQLCALLNGMHTGSCSEVDGNLRLVDVGLLDLVLAKGSI